MYIFTCENTFEDMMCCIYHAWEKALKVGMDVLDLKSVEKNRFLYSMNIYMLNIMKKSIKRPCLC